MKPYWDKLTRIQQRNLVLGCGLVVILMVWQLLLSPFLNDIGTVKKAIRNNEKIRGEMLLLAKEYRGVKSQAEAMRRALALRPREFTLFSHLEKIASDAGVKPNLKYINALQGAVTGPYEELPVELKLEKITLRQLTNFLYRLEAPQELIRVKKITISRMKDNSEYLDAQAQVSTFQLTQADRQ